MLTRTSKTILASAAATAVVLFCGAASCGEYGNDAPRAAVDETSPARVIQMPDGFSNIATKCVDGVRYTTIYHASNAVEYSNYGSVSVVADPACAR